VTINTALGTETLLASPSVAATATGTFSGTPAAGQAITIVNGANATVITATTGASTTATGSFTFATNAESYCSHADSGVTIGNVVYYFMTDLTAGLHGVSYCYSCEYDEGNNTCTDTPTSQTSNVLVGATEVETAQNLAAAINLAGNGACATTSVGYYGAGGGTCYWEPNGANKFVTAVAANNVVTLTATAAGAAGNCTPGAYPGGCQTGYGWANLTNSATYTGIGPNTFGGLSGGAGGSNSCTAWPNATFMTDANTTTEATNLAGVISACPAASGVTATSLGNTVTVTARTMGAAGNNIALGTNNVSATFATGSVSIITDPNDWPCPENGTVTIGATVYGPFNCGGLTGVNQPVQYYGGASAAQDEAGTAMNFEAVVNNNSAECQAPGACLAAGQTANAQVVATQATNYVNLTATIPGTGGNFTVSTDDATDFSVAGGNNGVNGSGAMTGFAWTASVGTPPCNGGGNNPCRLGGGVSGATTATSFATDGVPGDDATQLALAINTAPNPLNTGVTATAMGSAVTVTAPGACSNTLISTAPGFAWGAGSMAGGSNGVQSATGFVYWNGCNELPAGQIAGNIVASINANGALNANLTAINTSGPSCTANCSFTLNANANGAIYDYPLVTTFVDTTFFWSCPPGTPASAMCGGANGVVWTYQGPGNGQTTYGQPTGTSGIVADALDYPAWAAAHPYSLNQRITDSNGFTESTIKAGTSGGTTPVWCETAGCTTPDGSVTWGNVEPSPTANLYYGTLSGTGGNKGVKLTQKGLQ
jgi:hypothetical protein